MRKALTTQLHTLRQELGPKEETLMRVQERLQETDREYELSLQAIAEKEKNLNQKSENLNLLQKQVKQHLKAQIIHFRSFIINVLKYCFLHVLLPGS